MKFKIGDLIKGKDNRCKFTNADMEVGIVEDIWLHPLNAKEEYIDIRIINHKNSELNGKLYPSRNKIEYFEIIR